MPLYEFISTNFYKNLKDYKANYIPYLKSSLAFANSLKDFALLASAIALTDSNYLPL